MQQKGRIMPCLSFGYLSKYLALTLIVIGLNFFGSSHANANAIAAHEALIANTLAGPASALNGRNETVSCGFQTKCQAAYEAKIISAIKTQKLYFIPPAIMSDNENDIAFYLFSHSQCKNLNFLKDMAYPGASPDYPMQETGPTAGFYVYRLIIGKRLYLLVRGENYYFGAGNISVSRGESPLNTENPNLEYLPMSNALLKSDGKVYKIDPLTCKVNGEYTIFKVEKNDRTYNFDDTKWFWEPVIVNSSVYYLQLFTFSNNSTAGLTIYPAAPKDNSGERTMIIEIPMSNSSKPSP